MTFDDRISISTPEGLEIELNLAGLGSRIGAALIDALLLGLLVVLAAFGIFGLVDRFPDPMLAIGIGWLMLMVLVIGYFVAFEALNDGRTPGKAAFSIRVVGVDGAPVGFGASMVRNLLRLVDLFPLFPLLGPIAILASSTNQRLGDMAGRTIVIRDTRSEAIQHEPVELDARAGTWDVTAVTDGDVDLARRFLARREDLTSPKREEHARAIAERMRSKVPNLPPDAGHEWVIEQVTAAKVARRPN
ncbi:MAG TPA: RDD family protein [Acidimicrobiia bacterium]|nr:RDD family protein [Acidimicrobiia bacterium]